MAKEQTCVVCGQGSHREKWVKGGVGAKGTVFVACDSHSDTEIKAAVAKAEPAAVPTPVTQTPTTKV